MLSFDSVWVILCAEDGLYNPAGQVPGSRTTAHDNQGSDKNER